MISEITKFLSEHSLSATPENFSVAHGYLGPGNKPLKERVDTILSVKNGLDQSSMNSLFSNYIATQLLVENVSVLQEIKEVPKKVVSAHHRLTSLKGSISKKLKSLTEIGLSINQESSPETMRAALSDLSDELSGLSMQIQEAEIGLNMAHEDIAGIAESVQRIEARLSIDYLTGMPGERLLNEDISRTLSQQMSGGITRSNILVAKVEHLKYFNQAFSRLAGDSVIRRAAKVLSETLPKDWRIYHYAGGKFVVLPVLDTNSTSLLSALDEINGLLKKKVYSFAGKLSEKPIRLIGRVVPLEIMDDPEAIQQEISK